MIDDPRKAKTMEEAGKNPDGTWNAIKVLSWLSECLNPGKGIPEEEVRSIWEKKKANREGKK